MAKAKVKMLTTAAARPKARRPAQFAPLEEAVRAMNRDLDLARRTAERAEAAVLAHRRTVALLNRKYRRVIR
jgi:hypothetical protein